METWLEEASEADKEIVRTQMEEFFGGMMPENSFRFSLSNYIGSMEDGANLNFAYEVLKDDWFAAINQEKVQAVMSLLGSPITPERSSGSVWWERLAESGARIATMSIK